MEIVLKYQEQKIVIYTLMIIMILWAQVQAQFCALNVNTGEKTNINNVEYDFNTPMRIKGFCDNGLYYQAMYCGDMGPVPLYYSSLDGKINKLISENVVHGTGSINIYNDKLYYTELKCEEGIFIIEY